MFGNYIYLVGGNPLSNSSKVFMNLYTNGGFSGWVSQNDLPEPLLFPGGFVYNGYLYVMGGHVEAGPVLNDDIYRAAINPVDGTLGAWEGAGQMAEPVTAMGVLLFGNKVFVVGGFANGADTDHVWRGEIAGDGSVGNWQAMTPLPQPTNRAGVAATAEVILVAGGIFTDKTYWAGVDGSGNMSGWSPGVNLPQAVCCGSLTVAANGYAYLTGGFNGGQYLNTVYYSQVGPPVGEPTPAPLPQPTPTPPPGFVPLIFVPGIGASWSYEALVHGQEVDNEVWDLGPYVNVYDGFFAALENGGYTPGDDFIVYNYDWRDEIGINAGRLADFIESEFPGQKVDLIGHSMGGLISRTVTQNHPEMVDEVITVDSPHKGAVTVYKFWEGADFSGFPGWQRLATKLVLRINRSQYGSGVEEVRAMVPSFRNLLPVFDYLKNNNGGVIPESQMKWRNNFLPGLNGGLNAILGQLSTTAGMGTDTDRWYRTQPRNSVELALRLWEDGKPVQTEYESGDNAVLPESARITPAANDLVFNNVVHEQMLNYPSVQEKIFETLGLNFEPVTTQVLPDWQRVTLVTVASPATFKVVGPGGQIYLPEAGLVAIDNSLNGEYRVEVTATGVGNFTVYFGRLDGDDEAWEERSGSFSQSGQVINFNFLTDYDMPNLGADPLGRARERLNSLISSISKSNLARPQKGKYVGDLRLVLSWVGVLDNKYTPSKSYETAVGQIIRQVDTTVKKKETKPEWRSVLWLVKEDVAEAWENQLGL